MGEALGALPAIQDYVANYSSKDATESCSPDWNLSCFHRTTD